MGIVSPPLISGPRMRPVGQTGRFHPRGMGVDGGKPMRYNYHTIRCIYTVRA